MRHWLVHSSTKLKPHAPQNIHLDCLNLWSILIQGEWDCVAGLLEGSLAETPSPYPSLTVELGWLCHRQSNIHTHCTQWLDSCAEVRKWLLMFTNEQNSREHRLKMCTIVLMLSCLVPLCDGRPLTLLQVWPVGKASNTFDFRWRGITRHRN